MYLVFCMRVGAVFVADVMVTLVVARDVAEAKNMYQSVHGAVDGNLYKIVALQITEAQ